jgi:hypothetical protein
VVASTQVRPSLPPESNKTSADVRRSCAVVPTTMTHAGRKSMHLLGERNLNERSNLGGVKYADVDAAGRCSGTLQKRKAADTALPRMAHMV